MSWFLPDFIQDIKETIEGIQLLWWIVWVIGVSGVIWFILGRKETTIWVISTYKNTSVPDNNYIKSAIWRFLRPVSNTVLIIEDLSPNYSKENINTFIINNTSKINDLLQSNEVISLFLFWHMPLVTYLGYKFWTVKSTELYHILRPEKKSKWKWDNSIWFYKKSLHQRNWKYETTKNIIQNSNEIILNISISFPIKWENIIEASWKSIYSISLDNNRGYIRDNREFLRYKSQLKEFENIIKKVINDIETSHQHLEVIHLFLTTPNPFSFIVWQYIHHNWPKVYIYDKDITGNYNIILTLNCW